MFSKTLLWDITYKCNLKCKHCYNSDKMDIRLNDELNLLEYERIMESLVDCGVEHIHLLGGEPLQNCYVFEIVKMAVERDITVTINTNFVFNNQVLIDKILECGISQITISLESPVKEVNDSIRGEGSFDSVVRNLDYLGRKIDENESNIIVQIATVITEVNYKTISLFPEFLLKSKVNYLELLSLYNCGSAREKLDNQGLKERYRNTIAGIISTLEEQKKTNSLLNILIDAKPLVIDYINRSVGIKVEIPDISDCVAVSKVLFMEPDGKVFICGPSSQIEEYRKFGNSILETDFEISKYNEYKMAIMNRNSVQYSACKECAFSKTCKGKCPIDNTLYSICDYVSELIKAENKRMLTKQYCICAHILVYKINNEIVVYDCDSNTFKHINGWKMKILDFIYEGKFEMVTSFCEDTCYYNSVSIFIEELINQKIICENVFNL